jgi:uncharacterized protein
MVQAYGLISRAVTVATQWPLLAYFALAYVISWGGVLLLAVFGFPFGILGQSDWTIVFVVMLLGPSASGLIVTLAFEGRDGFRDLLGRVLRWRVGLRWYAVALFTTPTLLLPILWVLGWAVDPVFNPQFRLPLFVIGMLAGFFEELGWTGYATPRMLADRGVFRTGLTLGILWALWHLPADMSGNLISMGWNWPVWFTIFWIATLIPYRVLMTWVFARTGSVLLGMLMHAGYTGWMFVFSPATSVQQGLIWQAGFAVCLWIAAIAAARTARRPR